MLQIRLVLRSSLPRGKAFFVPRGQTFGEGLCPRGKHTVPTILPRVKKKPLPRGSELGLVRYHVAANQSKLLPRGSEPIQGY